MTGFVLLIGQALFRMTPRAITILGQSLTATEWTGLALSVLFFGVLKGYVAFHRGYAPRFARRLVHVIRLRRASLSSIAPLYCMGFVHVGRGNRGAWIRTVAFILAIVLMIIGVRGVGDPWREIIVAGVLVALAFGGITTVIQATLAVLPVMRAVPDGGEVLATPVPLPVSAERMAS